MIDNDEQFPSVEAKECYEGFPADMSSELWQTHLADLIGLVDLMLFNRNKLVMSGDLTSEQADMVLFCGATARKARDVVVWTLSDDKVPTLLAALVECSPLLDAMRAQAQQNIMKGVKATENIAANGMLGRLDAALKAFQQ